jgi:hypothetical protein
VIAGILPIAVFACNRFRHTDTAGDIAIHVLPVKRWGFRSRPIVLNSCGPLGKTSTTIQVGRSISVGFIDIQEYDRK